jgi:(2Fe-2S) ferredoxin
MKIAVTPHALHLLFCTNTRADKSQSCGDAPDIHVLADELKARFKNEKLPVRVTRTGCLGPCAQGPNIMGYPHGLWFQEVKTADADAIVARVKEALGSTAATLAPQPPSQP